MEKLLNEMQVKINQLATEGCHGCQIDYPSQRRHACCMLNLDERVLMYFDEAFCFIDSEFILPALKEVLYEKLLIQAVGPQTAEVLYGVKSEGKRSKKNTIVEAVSSTTGDGEESLAQPPPPPSSS